tara:strand:- start:815 stop:1183 length:369 start_codon:yes stop_codon:yes gene_type:complete
MMVKNSYETFLDECGITRELDDAVRNYTGDLDLRDIEGVSLRESTIHGQGVFADKFYAAGYGAGWASLNGKRTIIGRYTNHSDNPNCTVMPTAYGIILVTLESIAVGDEMTIDYRDALNAAD